METIRHTLSDVKAGPKTILGSNFAASKEIDTLLAGKRVLIADDELNIRRTISEVLTKSGCICSVCKDGYEAINLIEEQDFDLVISDIKMPHCTGYEIYAAARRRREDLPVLLITGFGYDPHHSIVRASQEGLASVLFKPFKVEELLEAIRKALVTKLATKAEAAPTTLPPSVTSGAPEKSASSATKANLPGPGTLPPPTT